jgi:endonuclease/exonuclease/phosphatase (EEP) superfamily protein YafD
LVALWSRQRRTTAVAVALLLANTIPLAPLYAAPPPEPPATAVTYRALSLNTWEGVVSTEAMERLVAETDPDLIVLVEVPYDWPPVERLSRRYPHVTQALIDGEEARVVLSRYPFAAAPTQVADLERPSAVVQVEMPEGPLTVFATHVVTPMSPERWQDRNRQLAKVAAVVRSQPGPVLLLGDLNNTSWAPTFTHFAQTAGLEDARRGFGRQPTWPTSFPAPRLPLDHALVSPDVAVADFQTGPDVGSDHLPIIVDFTLPAAAQTVSDNSGN